MKPSHVLRLAAYLSLPLAITTSCDAGDIASRVRAVSRAGSTSPTSPTSPGAAGTPGPACSGASCGGVATDSSPGTGNGGGNGASPSPTPAASPAAKAGLGVTIVPQSRTLKVPPANPASASANLASSYTLKATVNLLGGGSNARVDWTSADPGKVAISSTGVATVHPDAPEGLVEIRAAFKDDPTLFATASVIVTRDTDIEFTIQ